jgi:hypothetical protein
MSLVIISFIFIIYYLLCAGRSAIKDIPAEVQRPMLKASL